MKHILSCRASICLKQVDALWLNASLECTRNTVRYRGARNAEGRRHFIVGQAVEEMEQKR